MQFTVIILALFSAVAIAGPIAQPVAKPVAQPKSIRPVRRGDTAPVMTNAAKEVVPFNAAEIVKTDAVNKK